MTKTLTFLIASTALTALVGLPAWSAMRAPVETTLTAAAAAANQQLKSAGDTARMLLVDDDEDEDEGRSADTEDDDHGKCGEDDDDDEDSCGGAGNPAPAGTVAPPQNGLFGDGNAPKVQSN